jgi:hypothetical protein
VYVLEYTYVNAPDLAVEGVMGGGGGGDGDGGVAEVSDGVAPPPSLLLPLFLFF